MYGLCPFYGGAWDGGRSRGHWSCHLPCWPWPDNGWNPVFKGFGTSGHLHDPLIYDFLSGYSSKKWFKAKKGWESWEESYRRRACSPVIETQNRSHHA